MEDESDLYSLAATRPLLRSDGGYSSEFENAFSDEENGHISRGDGPTSSSDRNRNQQTWRATLNLFNATTGTSTIAVPLIMLTLGVGPSLIAIFIQGGLGVLANAVLSRESRAVDKNTYEGLMNARAGRWAGSAAAGSSLLNGCGKIAVWLIIMTDVTVGKPHYSGLLPELLRWHGAHISNAAWYMQRWVWAVIFGTLSLPGISCRSLDYISGVSSLSDLAVLFVASASVTMAGVAAHQGKLCPINWMPSGEALGVSGAHLWLKAGAVLPIMLSSVFNQQSVLSVARQVHPYKQRSLDIACVAANAAVIVSKLAIGAANVGLFGSDTKADVLLNFTAKGLEDILHPTAALVVSASVRLAFLANGMFSFPMYLWPLQANFWALIEGEQAQERRMNSRRTYISVNYLVVAGCVAAAAVLGDVEKPLKVLGATAVGYLAFIAPAMLLLRRGSEWGWVTRVLACTMIVLGIVQAILGLLSVFL